MVRTVQNATGYTPSGAADEDVITEFVYDAAGRQIATVAADGQVTRTYFDGLYRPIVMVQNLTGQPITNSVPPAYNPALPAANVRQETRYDDAGRVYEQEDNAGMVTRTG